MFVACEEAKLPDDTDQNPTEQPENPGNTDDPENPGNTDDPEDPGNTDDPENPGTGEEPGDSTSPLAPDAHKQKLEEIALEIVNDINLADFEALIGSLSYFEDFFAVEEDVICPDEEIIIPGEDEYIDDTTRALKSFSVAGLINAVTRASEQIILDVNDEDFDFNGAVIEFTEESEEPSFEYGGNPGECLVKWVDSVATFSWGETKGQYTYIDEEEDVEYIVKIPAYINLSLKISGVEHLNINVVPNFTDNYTYAPQITITLNGGYKIVSKVTANNEKIGYDITLEKSGKKLIGGTAEAYVPNFTDVNNWLDEYTYEENGEEYTETYLDPEDYLESNITTAQFRLDALELSIIGSGNLRDMYDELDVLENDENASYDKAYYNEYCAIVNKYFNMIAVYNDTEETIADIELQSYYYEEYDGEGTVYSCGSEPVLVFPDGSKVSLDEYFTAESFSRLLERLQELYGNEYEE